MASKQLGKLKQWAGEVISREKTTVSDEFRELEEDIDLRRHGVKRLLAASNAYHHVLSKKRECAQFLDDPAEYLPVDALGMAMIVHGEDFPEDSAFGSCLLKFGRAHCKIATLQETYAMALRNAPISSMESLLDEMKDCKLQRKKLESRRLSYDAALSKVEKLKTSKKEKDKKEAEDELQQAKLRYEEMAEDVRSRMRAIQDEEISQLRDLTTFLDLELHFATQYVDVLNDVKAEWCAESVVNKREPPKRSGSSSSFVHRTPKNKPFKHHEDLSSSEDDEEVSRPRAMSTPSTRRSPFPRKSGSAPESEVNSRTPSSRKRSESASAGVENKQDKDKDKEKTEKSRRLTVPGWASSAVGSVTKKSKDTFAALTGGGGSERLSDVEGGESITQATKRKSKDSVGSPSPKITSKILKPPALQNRKLVRAIHDFNGSSEELSFRTGDEILVVNEVLDEWWMGELDGRKGLFPTVYTEVIKPDNAPDRLDDGLSSSSECVSSDVEGDQLYGAHRLSPVRNPYVDRLDAASIESSDAEEQEQNKLIPPKVVIPPSLTRARSANAAAPLTASKRTTSTESVVKRAPPPPPRRHPASNGPASGPPVPERRPGVSRSKSSPAATPFPTSPSTSSHEYETSPFESASDFTATATAMSSSDCGDFRQNPFKSPGMCNNCFTLHT